LVSLVVRSPYGLRLDLHSLPTRRSSDLGCAQAVASGIPEALREARAPRAFSSGSLCRRRWRTSHPKRAISGASISSRTVRRASRSEEHTSELQSPDHLVCRLLLEKKNKI